MSGSRPSVTAAVVAATLLLLRDDPELGTVVDRATLDAVGRSVREAIPGVGWALDHVPWRVLRGAGIGLERIVSPGFVAHYALRKHLIRTHLLRAIEAGHRQVVLVGAGFDMLSAAVPDEAKVFELDLPATQEAKRRSLEGAQLRAVEYVPIDLSRESLGSTLRRVSSFDEEADTVFVAEGLLMYLEREHVERVIADATALRGRVRFIASIVTPDDRGRVRMHTQHPIVDVCMRLLGERFRWGASVEGIDEMFRSCGLELAGAWSPADLSASVVRPTRPLRRTGEVVVVASGGAGARREVTDVELAATLS